LDTTLYIKLIQTIGGIKMRSKTFRIVVISIFAIVLVGTVIMVAIGADNPKEIDGNYAEYTCDVKNFRFATKIEIKTDDTLIGTVSGNIFTFVIDPLTLYDPAGNQIAYAGDDYHFFVQDSHAIYLNNGLAVEMVGQAKFYGEKYEIYDINQNKIATANFNGINTAGEMYDTSGKLIATYDSALFFKDYDVKISEECKIDDNVVLMIFASYYSDQAADSKASSSSSRSHSNNN